ncbi:MAG: hypothetical protein ACKO5C_04730 [Ferruginibacter sp.]
MRLFYPSSLRIFVLLMSDNSRLQPSYPKPTNIQYPTYKPKSSIKQLYCLKTNQSLTRFIRAMMKIQYPCSHLW